MTYRLAIATPVDGSAITGAVCANGYAEAMALILRDNSDVKLMPAKMTYSVDIVRARNRVAAAVLRDIPDCTHILWWDSDVVPHDLNVIARMLATGADLIGAPYLRKRTPNTWVHRPIEGHGFPTEADRGKGWMPVKSLGMGFTLTSTGLLRAMAGVTREYIDKRTDGTKHKVRGWFDLSYIVDDDGDTVQESEDYSFCHRARATPLLYIGPGSLMSHVGTHAFTPGVK